MRRRQVAVGTAIGLMLAAAILSLVGSPSPGRRGQRQAGAILSDCDGAIRELVIQYVPAAAEIVAPVYREFLGALPADVTVHVVCPDAAAFEDLKVRIGPVACTLSPIAANHAMTAWSRDRWLAMAPTGADRAVTLLAPRGEEGAERWPARAGDRRIAWDIAAALGPDARATRSSLYFDGGDFVADSRTVFVTPRVAERNVQHTVGDREQLLRTLRQMLKREVVLLEQAPDHHAGMYMMPVGGNTMLVGDPRLASQALGGSKHPKEVMPCGADFSAETQRRFDGVARRCREAGYRVVRIPIVPGRDGRTYVTYLNVLVDQRGGRRIVYLPTFRGMAALNAAAASVWRGLDYEVRPVDCTTTYEHFGSLRCLVNVLRRR